MGKQLRSPVPGATPPKRELRAEQAFLDLGGMELFEHPPLNQSNMVNALGLGNPPDSLDLLGLHGHSDCLYPALEHWFGDFFQLIFIIYQ